MSTRKKAKSAGGRQTKPLLSYFRGRVSKARSAQMSSIRGKDTGPEIALRKVLAAKGARFRLHSKTLPGRPDLSNKRAKVAVFVDGCFWHGCPVHFKLPKTRAAFWGEKIARNKEKRVAVKAAYPLDWHIIELYECDLTKRLEEAAEQIGQRLALKIK